MSERGITVVPGVERRGSAGSEVGAVRTRMQLAEEVELGLTGSLNHRRTALRFLTLLRPELADWAVLVLPDERTGSVRLHGGSTVSFTDVVSHSAISGTRLDRLLRTGSTELTAVVSTPDDGPLVQILPHPQLRGEVIATGATQLLAVGLSARGATLGVLLLSRTGGFDAEDVALATRIAPRAAVALDSARLYEERAQIAAVLSRALRPPSLPDIDNIRLAARYRPAAAHLDIGGDFYDVIATGSDWLLTLGDVCGKGVEAASLTGRTRQSIRTAAHFDGHPASLLRALNTVLHGSETDQFVTVLCARLRVAAAHADVELATAGHPAPIILRSTGEVEQPELFGTASGLVPDVHYRTLELRLHPGDTMLMFTDGVEEARGADGLYGVERLMALLPEYAGASPDVVCEAIEQDVVEYVDSGPHDDIALLAVTCGR